MGGPRATDRSRLEQLAEEQAALRRVATLVAQGAPTEALFALVAEQVAEVLDVPLVSIVRYEHDGTASERASVSPQGAMFEVGTRWSIEGTNVVAQVLASRGPARIDDYTGLTGQIAETVRSVGIRSTVGIPIEVAGRLWGAMVVSSAEPEILPADTEAHLAAFTELVATAIANAEASEEVQRLAAEQAALRRVATLVARDAPSTELFGAVAREAGALLRADFSAMLRFEADGAVTPVATWAAVGDHPPVPARWRTGPGDPTRMIAETGRAARVEDWTSVPGPIAAFMRRELGVSSSVGGPIMVDGRLWGGLAVHCKRHARLPPDTESRLQKFTDLVATAIANTDARAEVTRLAHEQGALRRVATLVAHEASQSAVFTAIAEEIGRLLGTEEIQMLRFEEDRSALVMARWGRFEEILHVGSRLPIEDAAASSQVFRTGRPARSDYRSATGPLAERVRAAGIRSVLATPILVEGRLWGAMVTGTSQDEPLPPDTELRLAQFTELMATAIANTESRARADRLAQEQAGLRRVATLVAEGGSPTAVFDAVAAEMETVLSADQVSLSRYEPGDAVTVVAHRGANASRVPPGSRVSHKGDNVTTLVRQTERPARIDHSEGTRGAVAGGVGTMGMRLSVGAPIVVDGRLWGVISARWRGDAPPPGTEERMAKFAELLDTAIANAHSRDQLTASRARLLTEGDEARRRVVRDLHDGAQQRLVHTILMLTLARQAVRDNDPAAESLLDEALEHAERSNTELRELAQGILPSALTHGGLRAGVRAVVARLDLPVRMDIPRERFPTEIEASAYFIVAEALTNVVKHARAESAAVRASVEGETLHIEVRDDGTGGADAEGHGLVGIRDRATALGGRLEIHSPAGGGTLLAAALPLSDR